MYELRTAVMILVEASWRDENGASRTSPARMEDKSAGGACIRLKTAVEAGTRLKIQSRWEQFSGIAKYCRSEGTEYLVGIQRDISASPVPTRAVSEDMPPSSPTTLRTLSRVEVEGRMNLQARPEPKLDELSPARRSAESATGARAGRNADLILPRGFGRNAVKKDGIKDRPSIPPPQDLVALRRTDLQTKPPPRRKEAAGKAWKLMGRKWLDLKPWHKKAAFDGESGDRSAAKQSESEGEMANRESSSRENAMVAEVVPRAAVELLGMEDICRAAGIMTPPKGYGIAKVVEMINSEHIRGLSREMKRAAVLMALNAARVSIGQVLQDYKVRQEALDFYEAGQKQQAEAEWARRAEEIIQIQAEMERVKAQFMTRISRSMEGVTREKVTFNNWLILKQQETQDMSEAADLCSKVAPPEPAKPASSEASSPPESPKHISEAAPATPADATMAKAAGVK